MECAPDLSFLTMAAAANSEIYKMATNSGDVYQFASGGELYAKMMRPGVMIKQRKTNFTPREVEVLLAAVDKHRDIVLFGTAGGQVWARAWQEVAREVTAVEGIHRTEGDVRKKWTYLKWEAKNTSKPGRDPTSRAVLEILTGGDPEAAATIGARSLLEELLVPAQNSGQSPHQQTAQQPNQSQQQQREQQNQNHQTTQQQQQAQTLQQREQQTPNHQQTQQAAQPQQQQSLQQQTQPQQQRSQTSSPSSPSPAVVQTRKLSVAAPVSPPEVPTEVCLRWNSYHSNMQAVFPSLLNNEQFVDVTLACEGQSIKCHKIMLSACSNYFEELLSQNPCHHPIVLMKDLRFWEVQALVDFMYRGEVNVSQDRLPSLLAAAEALQIKGLAGPATTNYHGYGSDGMSSTGSSRRPHRKRKSGKQMHKRNTENLNSSTQSPKLSVPNMSNVQLRHSNSISSPSIINSISTESSPQHLKQRRVASPQISHNQPHEDKRIKIEPQESHVESNSSKFESEKVIKDEPQESHEESNLSKFETINRLESVQCGMNNREEFLASLRELERIRKSQELNQASSNDSDDYDYQNEYEDYETEFDENRSIDLSLQSQYSKT